MTYIIYEMLDECCDELSYSKHYYRKAKMLKDHVDLSRKYLSLAKAELEHAYILMNTAGVLYNSDEEKDKLTEVYEEKLECYNCEYDKLSYLINKMTY